MFSKIKYLWMLVFLMLFGCGFRNQNDSHDYLMLHPAHLQNLYNKCMQETADEKLPCNTIIQAQREFETLTDQRQEDPEKFGARVLQEQVNAVFYQLKLKTALNNYQQLATHPNNDALTKARTELDQAEQEYNLSFQKVKVLWSVIADNSRI